MSNKKATDAAVERIKEYLNKRAGEDKQFAAAYAKEGKTIEGCMGYICNEVRKSGRTMWANEEIFGMAVHYYNEDDITGEKMPSNVKIVATSAELKARGKKSAKPKAAKPVKAEEVKSPFTQLSLF